MRLIINGEELEFKEEITLLDLIKQLKIEDKVMAIAINLEVIKKNKWDIVKPKENDKIELLQFVGGG